MMEDEDPALARCGRDTDRRYRDAHAWTMPSTGALTVSNSNPQTWAIEFRSGSLASREVVRITPEGVAYVNGGTTPATDAELGAAIRAFALRCAAESRGMYGCASPRGAEGA